MGWHKWVPRILCLLAITMATNAYGVQVTIHDVTVDGSVLGQASGPGLGCAQLDIGSANGTPYTHLMIQGADGINPARIRAIEQGASCFGMAVNATRDRLILVNTRIIPSTNGVNIDLIIDYRGTFGPQPNNSVVFGGSMQGQFKRNSQGFTCTNTSPDGPCTVTYANRVLSLLDNLEHPLSTISRTNPINGNFNDSVPGTTINVGTLNRDLHSTVTTRLPSVNHSLETGTQFVVLGPPPAKKSKNNHLNPRPSMQ